MKKSILALLLALALALSLAACAGSEKETIISSEEEETEEQAEKTSRKEKKEEEAPASEKEEEPEEEESRSPYLTATYRVLDKDLYVDVPDVLKSIEDGCMQTFLDDGVKLFGIISPFWEDADDPEGAYETCFSYFKDLSDHYIKVNGMASADTETVTVGGMDALLFDGQLDAGFSTPFEAYVRGCAFVLDGHPYMVVGAVVDPSQPQDQIDVVREVVDAMMASVRTEQ